jgi:hypothetical protein
MEVCRRELPPNVEVGAGRWARCWLYKSTSGDNGSATLQEEQGC